MENYNDIESVDRQHYIKLVNDKIAVIGELEHMRRHALRSCVTVFNRAKDEVGETKEYLDEKSTFYFLTALQATDIRRKYMEKHFPNLSDEDWCLCKSAATLRQLLYETDKGDLDLPRIDRMIDEVWGNALGMDLTGCRDCQEDRKSK